MATEIVSKTCPVCGKEFKPKEYRNKFCSHECYATHVGNRMRGTGKGFWGWVKKTETCWLWTGGTTTFGYGVYGTPSQGAHRLSWVEHFGPIPDGLFVLHNCPGGDNPACVNPSHLFLGTHAENMQDAKRKGRNASGTRHGHAKLDEAKVREIRTEAANGVCQRRLGERFGVSYATICNIVKRKSWTLVD